MSAVSTLNIDQLTEANLVDAVAELGRRDADLAAVVAKHGLPPLWARKPGFATMVHIILEQQVSLASAKAAFDRLAATLGTVTPRGLLTLDDAQLKQIGFSWQKTAYARHLAQAIVSRQFSFKQLERMDDEAARRALVRLKGIGPWTADIYLLMVLRRPDVWPIGDLALQLAAQRVKALDARPTPLQLDALGESWRPYRAVAARVLWHHYLSERAVRTAKDT